MLRKCSPIVASDHRLVHTLFVPSGYCSPCAPLVWNQGFPTPLSKLAVTIGPVKAPAVRFSSSQFRKQQYCHENVVSRNFMTETIYAWPCESISRSCQADEITRLQSTIEETNNRLSVNQKRAEEREMRLRKLENENVSLLVHHNCIYVVLKCIIIIIIIIHLRFFPLQIICLNKQIDRQYTSLSTTPDGRHTDSTNQQLLIADLQVRLRQAIEDRDIAREQLTTNLTRAETSTLDIQQQYMLDKVSKESERYQREFKQASSRIQQLSRQLQETQSNCDSIARQRDSLRDQLDQGRSGSATVTSIFGINSSTGGMRPASAGPGNYDNVPLYGTTSGTTHLSREMDRLHRECENLQNQLRISQESEQESRSLVDNLKNDIKNLTNEIEQFKEQIKELEKQKMEYNNELTKTQRELQTQTDETKDKLTHTQQLLIEKTSQLENAANQLNNVRQYCSELEQRINEMSQRLNMAESHVRKCFVFLEVSHNDLLSIVCSNLHIDV
ncbi:rab6-interacting protein 2/elks/erc/cast,putative [Schistosoma mansoni]|uniref:rab6-interacting protein 2/elks/erc/cast,putative n=1 Tax=Schistosoma mansoni TaxID=6183 RepID=UPI00022C8533|nr:rab6-interacting protein 2/elks/erc/cast,putative [Schistosoma mansoni]|eukprot:XP_018647443.1 rab6-interacting protein 2/elks/erc/cast,putative [Schistosoma mansoni]